ncbi:hypothetical protein [Methylobacterium sp. ap11]|uniref:hypothetical protein n=1 Tax=Methylobacterium sp. ap11 TaxID=1761799 RepID=UPI000B82AD1F|nr:hypothetical protein [Methylobacterium sp. ap11]
MLLTLLPAALLPACTPGQPVSVTEIEAFIGVTLPPGHRDLRSAHEAGIDRLVRFTFEAPEAEAAAVAARLVPGGLTLGADAGITIFGGELDGWLTSLPEGAAGGEVLVAGRLARKVVVAPAGSGLQRVWVAVFTL